MKKTTEKLIREIISGEIKRDILPDNAMSFTGEYQALYFSNLRKNFSSDMEKCVITYSQNLDDLKILKEMGGG